MSQNATRAVAPVPMSRRKGIVGVLYELWKNKSLYVMLLPACVLLFLFNYMPLFGLVLVFKDFDFGQGIFGSPFQTPWYGNFIFLFKNEGTFRAVGNTLIMNALFIVFGTISAISLALLLNELYISSVKRVVQSFTLLPHFISTIIISVFVYQLFSDETGMVNGLLRTLGLPTIHWYESPQYWRVIMTCIHIWKSAGYNSVIYLATISSIDGTLYEAAEIDGAKRFQRIWYVTLPLIRPTIITMSLLALGRIMNNDFGFFYAIVGDNALLFPTMDVLDTFIYRYLRRMGDFTMAGAASFVQSVIAGIILVTSNTIARRYEDGASLF